MPKFVLIYHGKPDCEGPEESARHMTAWNAWRDGMGAAVVDPGVAVGPSKTITAIAILEDGGANPTSGVTIIQADTMEAAISLAQSCPHLSGTGTIEIAQALDMEM
ncbi:MAG: hypothetical protein ABJL67_21060 [Sulfitobacter sp.]